VSGDGAVELRDAEGAVRCYTLALEATKAMAMEHPKLRGTVKTIKKAEGYGFITHDATGVDHFFHRSNIERTSPVSFDEMEVSNAVEFRPVESLKGPRALDVVCVE
jgi:cold shock CspA family protein